MLAIPAIDLKGGKVVRLVQGRHEETIVYSHYPLETAKSWEKEGAGRLHIVDLDGAQSGEIKNLESLRSIVEGINVPIQFGGGLRSREDIEAIIKLGVKWAILGTKACEDLDFAREILAEFGEQIIVSIDVKYKKVATRGWTQISAVDDVDLINKLKMLGVKSFIYTDISRDGTLLGSNIMGVKAVLQATGASIFYSGGISTLEDVKNLRPLEKLGLAGVIIGKALYENKIHLSRVINLLEGKL